MLSQFEEGRLARLQRYGNLGPLARLTFDTLIPQGRSPDPRNQERFRRALATCIAYAEAPQGWLVLTGPSGCGKTHLAAAIANKCLAQGIPAFFAVVPDLLDHLRATFRPDSDIDYDDLFEQVRNAPLLVLDDLGTQSSTPWAQEKLFQIINHRYNARLPTVVTTNLAVEELDERLRTRLADPGLSEIVVAEAPATSFQLTGSLELELLSNMTFDNFDWKVLHLTAEQQESIKRAYRAARAFAESPQGWLVLLGPNGCGKTHLAAAVANYQQRAGRPVFFAVVPDLLDHFRSAFNPESKLTYDETFEIVKATPLLILDDLGTQSSTPWAQEKLYQLLNYRYNARLPTLITSNAALEKMEDRLASRMGDLRLSIGIIITAPDYRVDRRPSEKAPAARQRGRRDR